MDTSTDGGTVKRKKKVYVETSVISYLTARDSHDVTVYAKQLATREWWDTRSRFNLYISHTVLDEIRSGDARAVRLREMAVINIGVLERIQSIKGLTDKLIDKGAVPIRARTDAAHIATASVHGMDFLVTWNQAHITNPARLEQINAVIRETGFTPPLLVRPDYFLEVDHADQI